MRLLFATTNNHKIKEVRKLLPETIELLTLDDIDYEDDLPETGNTIESNAIQKARYVHDKFGMDCFADDSGLEVHELGGRPGVYSARYAGNNADAAQNNLKLLTELKGITDRGATFKTVIALFINSEQIVFEGTINGHIILSPLGSNGFGYDPLFVPAGSDKTFAEMSESEKNSMSHRSIAVSKLVEFLNKSENTRMHKHV